MMAEQPVTTIASALDWGRTMLRDASDTHLMDARLLLSAALEVKQEYLIQVPERTLTPQQTSTYQEMVSQRAQGEPIAYLLGKQMFYDIEVCVTPDVLIPRPETELLVEKVIAFAKGKNAVIVDVGAGSGIIALALAKHLPTAQVTGIDLSSAALDVARCNSEHLGLTDRVRWLRGNLLQPMLDREETADVIVANLPYIPTDEMLKLDVSKHEPIVALDGGTDGLDVIRRFLENAPKVLRDGGLVMMEIGSGQGAVVKTIAEMAFPDATVRVDADLAGHERIVSIQKGA
jgi:release factor glutamine methyltransferase